MIDWLACLLVRVIGGGCCLLPSAAAVWIGERMGALAYWLQPKRTRIGLRNLRAAFDGRMAPAELSGVIKDCYRQLGAGLIELLRLPVIDRAYIDRYVTPEGRHHFDQAISSGKPVILLTGHFGNWEMSSIAAALNGYPIMALARAQDKLPRLYRLLISYRESKGCTIVHKGGAMKRLLQALERRQLVGIVGDQASRQGIAVEFFGRPALFATGPFSLAYSKGALLLPVFMHRVRGPHHRLVIEPPIELTRREPEAAEVRRGIEQFAGALARHILEAPSQWLWMHKRWKHTQARRLLVLSDGKAGHVKQSLAVARSLQRHRPDTAVDVIEIRYRHPLARAFALAWSWWMPRGLGATACLRLALTRASGQALLTRYADLIISCGASTAPANVLWAGANDAKSVAIMNPAPLPPSRFDLVAAPRHDRLPRRANVLRTAGALVEPLENGRAGEARGRLQAHPRRRADLAQLAGRPVVAVFIGGDTPDYAMDAAFIDALTAQLRAACEALDGWCLVTTSRRTPPGAAQRLSDALEDDPRCAMLLLAHRDPLDGTMEGMLSCATVAVVTGESISMVSEACASGHPVVVTEPPARRSAATKQARFMRELAAEGYIRLAPVAALAHAIEQAQRDPAPARRLDSLATVRDSVAKLL